MVTVLWLILEEQITTLISRHSYYNPPSLSTVRSSHRTSGLLSLYPGPHSSEQHTCYQLSGCA